MGQLFTVDSKQGLVSDPDPLQREGSGFETKKFFINCNVVTLLSMGPGVPSPSSLIVAVFQFPLFYFY